MAKKLAVKSTLKIIDNGTAVLSTDIGVLLAYGRVVLPENKTQRAKTPMMAKTTGIRP